jgi:single-stranded DNA-binding protein
MSVNDLRIGILEGTITKDTELKHSETTHKPYVQFCIASNKSIKKNGNYEKDTVFF